jgi:ArsR family transcriptional regulator
MAQVRNRLSVRPRPETPRQAAACCRPVDDLLDPALFKALGDPTRVRLLACIAKCGRACAVGEVAECCSVDLSVVSRHLQALARAGLLAPSRSGRTVRYAVRYAEVAATFRALADAIAECAPDDRDCGKGGRHGCC